MKLNELIEKLIEMSSLYPEDIQVKMKSEDGETEITKVEGISRGRYLGEGPRIILS